MAGDLLETGLAGLGLRPTDRQLERSRRFLEELECWNRVYGFVRASGEDLVRRHFLDSLAGLPAILELPHHRRICDLGSGAGFPGIPLAIFMEDAELTLVERSAKRCAFLRNVLLLIGLSGTRVLEGDLAAVREEFDVVTFRALTPLDRELPQLRRLAGPAGRVVAYKGKLEVIRRELAVLEGQVRNPAIRPVRVPFLEDEERHLVIFEP